MASAYRARGPAPAPIVIYGSRWCGITMMISAVSRPSRDPVSLRRLGSPSRSAVGARMARRRQACQSHDQARGTGSRAALDARTRMGAGPRRIRLALGIRLGRTTRPPPRPPSRCTGQRDTITPPVTLSGALTYQRIYGVPVSHTRLSMMPRPTRECLLQSAREATQWDQG